MKFKFKTNFKVTKNKKNSQNSQQEDGIVNVNKQQQIQQNYQYNMLNIGPAQVEQYKNQEHQNVFKEANVRGASCRLPGNYELCIDLFQLIVIIAIYFVSDYWINEHQTFPYPFVALYVIYIIITIWKICTGSPFKYINNAKTREELEIYAEQMQNSLPIISYYAESFHYVIRSQFQRKRSINKRKRNKKVVSWSKNEKLIYTRCVDKTDDLVQLMKSNKILRLNTKFTWYKGNELAKKNYQLLCQALDVTASKKDKHHSGHDSSKIQGKVGQQLAFNSSIPCYLDKPAILFFYVFGLSILIDTFFYSVTGECDYNVQKVIYCDLFQGAQIQKNLINPIDNQQIQIDMQQQPNQGQQIQLQPMQMQPIQPMQMQPVQPIQMQQQMYAQPGMQPMYQQPLQQNQQQ